MNFSELKKSALSYLGFYGKPTEEALALMDGAVEEALALSHFRAEGKIFSFAHQLITLSHNGK